MGQVPTPGLLSLGFVPEVVCGSLTISATCSDFFHVSDLFWLQLSHCFNAVAAEALRKLVTTAALLIEKHILRGRASLWQSSMVDLFCAYTVSAFDLIDLVRPAWGTGCLCVSLASSASVLKEIRQQSHPLLALPCFQGGFYNVLLIFVGYCWPSKDIPCLLFMRRNAWLQLIFLDPSVKLMPWILFCR